MSISLGANGGSYSYPQENDPAGWGDDATNWASAVSAALGNIGLGGTVSTTSLIDMSGTTTKGFLPPKLTTVQRNAIATPPAGLVIYNTTTSQLEVYTGSSWFSVASNIDGNLTVNGNSTLNGTLTVTGATSLQSVTSTGETVNGVLSVTGNTTLVNVTGANITSTGTILAASGTSGSPGISFSGDTNSGFYSISDNVIGVSTNGTRVGEIGVGYGGFTGNVIQLQNSTNTFYQANTTAGSYSDVNSASATPWEISITPRYSNSKIIIFYVINCIINNPGAGSYFGFRIDRKIGSGAYSNIYENQRDVNGPYNFGIDVGGASSATLYTNATLMYVDSPATTSTCTYKLLSRPYNSGYAITINASASNSNGKSYVMVQEVQQ